jgi:hypothetical protein
LQIKIIAKDNPNVDEDVNAFIFSDLLAAES